MYKHINPHKSLTLWWVGHLCSQEWNEFYKMCFGVCPVHTLWLIDLAHRYNLKEPKLPPCPSGMRKMPVAFIKYTSLQGFPYHWEGGESNFTSHISPSHPFLILIQVSILEMILKEKIYDGKHVVHVGCEIYRKFDMYQVSFLLNYTLNMPRDVPDCSGNIHTRIR